VGLVSYLLIGLLVQEADRDLRQTSRPVSSPRRRLRLHLSASASSSPSPALLNYGEAFAKGPELAKLTFPGN